MKPVRLLLVFTALMLSACVTTTDDFGSPASKPEAARLNMDLGISYLRMGDYEEALIKLQRSLEEEPDNATAHRALGLTFERLGDPDAAEKEYRKAVKQAPEDVDSLNQLAVFLCLKGDSKEGLKLYERALKIPRYQNKAMLYTNAGSCAKEQDLALAEKYLRSALAQAPNYPSALLQMADVTYQQGYYLQSRAFIERYTANAPASPDVIWLAYRIEVAMDDWATAGELAERLLQEYPESIETRQLLDAQSDGN